MKTNFLSLLMTVLGVGFMSSCSEEIVYPKTLYYKGYEITDFKLYVGSPGGGREVTGNLDPIQYVGEDIVTYAPEVSSIVFESPSELTYRKKNGDRTVYYRFLGNLLTIENETDGLSGGDCIGDMNQLIQSKHIVKSCKATGNSIETDGYIPFGDGIFRYSEYFNNFGNMTNATDTIIWCAVNHIYN